MNTKIYLFKALPFLILAGCVPAEKKPLPAVSSSEENVLFIPPDTAQLPDNQWGKTVKYGLDLVTNTAKYLGPDGTVSHNLKNKMNCTNCHLESGRKPFGLNFFDSHRTYPQYRGREDHVLTMEQRVNNCIERPHSGIPLPLNSKEMLAIVSYIKWVGSGYDPVKHEGYGLKMVDNKGKSADSERGKIVYDLHCKSCHQEHGEGQFTSDKITYTYPPLWGKDSYQETSSMHRVLKAASFIKSNMPHLKATYDNPILTDQEALDVAAFINDGRIHKRPKTPYSSYPNLKSKPIDFFQGPYLDSASESQHIFGPWDELKAFYVRHGLKPVL